MEGNTLKCLGYIPWISQRSPECYEKIPWKKIDPFNRKNAIFKKVIYKFLFSNGKRSYQSKHHILRWKTVTSSLKTKIYYCHIREKMKTAKKCNAKKNQLRSLFLWSFNILIWRMWISSHFCWYYFQIWSKFKQLDHMNTSEGGNM